MSLCECVSCHLGVCACVRAWRVWVYFRGLLGKIDFWWNWGRGGGLELVGAVT